MKIRQTTARGQAGTRLFLCVGSPAEYFAILTLADGLDRMSGFVATAGGMDIPVVRPVTISLNFEEMSEDQVSAVADWMLLRSTGATVRVGEGIAPGIASQAELWASFLGGKNNEGHSTSGRGSGNTSAITISDERAHDLRRLGLASVTADGIVTRRNPRFVTGAPVSGFSAWSITDSASKIFPEVRLARDLDLDRAKSALACISRPSSTAVAWYGTPDAERGKIRSQAAGSYPVLACLIADSPTVARKVDAMEPIVDVLQERTGLSKASLKRLGRIRSPLPDGPVFDTGEQIRGEDALGVNRLRRTAVRGALSLDGCLGQLAKLPPDRTPQTDDDWMAFFSTLAGCAIPLSNALDMPAEKILEASKGNWESWRAQLARAADFDPAAFDRRALALSTIDALEAIEDFGRSVVLPLALRSIASTGQALPPQTPEYMRAAYNAAGQIILGKSKSLAASLLEVGRRYVSRIPTLMDIDGIQVSQEVRPDKGWERYGEDAFPVLAGDFTASNGLVVTPLRDQAQMQEESRRLGHCVGRVYFAKARSASSHLFSIQSADRSTSLSTIEIGKISDEGTAREIASSLVTIQHRGQSNRTPPAEAQAAYTEWMASLKAGRIDLNIEEIRRWRNHLTQIC